MLRHWRLFKCRLLKNIWVCQSQYVDLQLTKHVHSMKKLFSILAILIFLAGCSKKDDAVAPDAGSAVAGTYNVSRLEVDAAGTANDSKLALPVTNAGITVSATINATRKTEKTIGLLLTLKITGQPDDSDDFGEVEVRANGSNYDLFEGTGKVGTVVGNTLTIDATDSGTRVIIVGTK